MQGHIMRIALLAAAAALLAAAPAAAQPTRSDMTGPGLAGSGVAGVGYHGAAFRQIENALFRRAEGRVVFRSPAIACRVMARASLEAVELRDGGLRPPRRWANAAPFQPQAQADVGALLTEHGTGTPAARRVLAALRGGMPGEPGDEPEQLVAALAGLFREGDGVCPARNRWVAGERWAAALQAYEHFVREAPDASLDPISPELAIIGVVLRDLVDAALAASRA
jgi:hypothetical protein